MLSNRAYIGEAVHKGESYPGEHEAIIERETWDRVHAILQESPRTVRGAMAGALKKKLGLEVSSEKIEERGRVYSLPSA